MPDPSEHRPGTFRPITENEAIERLTQSFEREKDPKLYGQESDFFTKGLDLTIKKFGKPSVVYYPGSGTHVGPSFTPGLFESKVIYFDQDMNTIRKLKESGYDAYQGDVQFFVPGEVDLLIMFNFNHPKPPEFVKQGGYVICNNWHSAAASLKDNDDFELTGVIIQKPDTQEVSLLTQGLENYITEFESDEEWLTHDEFSFKLARQDVEIQNSFLPENKRFDTTILIRAIHEMKSKNINVEKVAYKKRADLWVFRRKIS